MADLEDESNDANTIRIMLATDNHIGYAERDPIRGQDSINSFKEILQLAVKHDVDFILLGGDLFHENRPSRDCIYQVSALLRQYTLGDKPIQIELLSDPDDGKAAGYEFPAINYEDPNLNVAIPVFSIHGNHDDPQGAGPEGALCALDMLSITGLINYMGKIDLPLTDAEVQSSGGGIAIRPVLLQKGTTRLGMYGVGNVKDARMHFELRSNRVRMYMPRDKDSWFNLLVVHQNRVKHGPQEFVPEGMFDDSVDLVVWGHEHDCRITPEPVAGKNYHISQPGSSIATSLADGESVEKHVALLEIRGKDYQLTPIALRTVRPFMIDDIILTDEAEKAGWDVGDQAEVAKYLKAKVHELIDEANKLWDLREEKAVENGDEPLPRMLPLVRLKIDTTGVSEMSNPIRLGQEFTGLIANPRDVLVFHRARKSAASKAANGRTAPDEPELSIDDPALGGLTAAEKLSRVRVGTLVKEYLSAQELQLLGEMGMGDAIQLFVDKDDAYAIQTYVGSTLKGLMKGVRADTGDQTVVDGDDLDEVLIAAKEKQDEEYERLKREGKAAAKGKGKKKAADSDSDASVDSMMMDVDVDADGDASLGGGGGDSDFEEEPPVKKRGATKAKAGASAGAKGKAGTTKGAAAKKAPAKEKAPAKGKGKAPAKGKAAGAKGKGKKKVESDEDMFDEDEDEDEVEEIQDDEEEVVRPVKKTNRAAVLGAPSQTKKAPAKKAAAAASSKQATLSFAPPGGGTGGRSTAGRAAASKAKGRLKRTIEVDSDDD